MNENQIVEDISKIISKCMLASKDNCLHINSFNWFIELLQNKTYTINISGICLLTFHKIKFIEKRLSDEGEFLHPLLPNEARLRNMTYSVDVACDIKVEKDVKIEKEDVKDEKNQRDEKSQRDEKHQRDEKIKKDEKKEHLFTFHDFVLFELPIMIGSKICKMYDLQLTLKHSLGECIYDDGGYFIIDGKEKMCMPYETEDFENNIQF